jgi:hypothetical protein
VQSRSKETTYTPVSCDFEPAVFEFAAPRRSRTPQVVKKVQRTAAKMTDAIQITYLPKGQERRCNIP